jgi:hypothetical protein
VVSIFLSQVTFLLLRVSPQNLPRRKASTYPLFSQHPGREALIEPLSRMPREIPWKPGFTLDQLIKQSRGFFLGSEIIGGAPWGWNVPLGNNTHEAELKLSPIDHRDWFIVGRVRSPPSRPTTHKGFSRSGITLAGICRRFATSPFTQPLLPFRRECLFDRLGRSFRSPPPGSHFRRLIVKHAARIRT